MIFRSTLTRLADQSCSLLVHALPPLYWREIEQVVRDNGSFIDALSELRLESQAPLWLKEPVKANRLRRIEGNLVINMVRDGDGFPFLEQVKGNIMLMTPTRLDVLARVEGSLTVRAPAQLPSVEVVTDHLDLNVGFVDACQFPMLVGVGGSLRAKRSWPILAPNLRFIGKDIEANDTSTVIKAPHPLMTVNMGRSEAITSADHVVDSRRQASRASDTLHADEAEQVLDMGLRI